MILIFVDTFVAFDLLFLDKYREQHDHLGHTASCTEQENHAHKSFLADIWEAPDTAQKQFLSFHVIMAFILKYFKLFTMLG